MDNMEATLQSLRISSLAGSDRGQLDLSSTIKFDINNIAAGGGTADIESALRHAWKQLRFEQPHLASGIRGNSKFVYQVPADDSAMEEWLRQTFIVQSTAPSANEACRSPSLKAVKIPTLTYIPKSSELMFRVDHCRTDGVGVMLFWHSYLTALTRPKKDQDIVFDGTESCRLPPPRGKAGEVKGLFPSPEQITSEQAEKLERFYAEYAKALPGIGPVRKAGTGVLPGPCGNEKIILPADMTGAIIKTCKENGVSVTSGVHAAILMGLVKYADPATSKESNYTTLTYANLRSYLPSPYNTSQYAVALYYACYAFTTRVPSMFWDAVDAFETHYKSHVRNPETVELADHHGRHYVAVLQGSSRSNTDPSLSSWGIVERYCQRSYGGDSVHVNVQDLKAAADIATGAFGLIIVYTFRGQLHLTYNFNEAFEEPVRVRAHLDEVKKILGEELV